MPMDERGRLAENRQYDLHHRDDTGGGTVSGRVLTIALLAVVGAFVVMILLLFLR
jgi:preprotein translocase subunit SecF